jgi:hypothetical protein
MAIKQIKRGPWGMGLQAIAFMCKPFYKLFFGRLDLRLSDKNTQRLADDIHATSEFEGLLEMYGGTALPPEPNHRPDGFDCGIVFIQFKDISSKSFAGEANWTLIWCLSVKLAASLGGI